MKFNHHRLVLSRSTFPFGNARTNGINLPPYTYVSLQSVATPVSWPGGARVQRLFSRWIMNIHHLQWSAPSNIRYLIDYLLLVEITPITSFPNDKIQRKGNWNELSITINNIYEFLSENSILLRYFKTEEINHNDGDILVSKIVEGPLTSSIIIFVYSKSVLVVPRKILWSLL